MRGVVSSAAVARIAVRRYLLDQRLTERQQSLAVFAHDFELVNESLNFGLASRTDLEEVEDRLVATWREIIELSAPSYSEQLTGRTCAQSVNLHWNRASVTT
ncbi:MAG TPA: hypothetical protein VMF32_26300 [Xanthobacteraceae bacterium]|nr:hypothetical protein [Xanthobacteraceae bacterium]